MNRRHARQAGFSFIEILVVMAIITVLVGAVVVVIPRVLERSRQTQSINNVRNMLDLMISRKVSKGGWQSYNGKNFVLYLVAAGEIDRRVKQNLEVFFSPGDELYKLGKVDAERYGEITSNSLKTNDFHELTSYAGRRNLEKDFLITPDRESMGVPIISDDDDGPLHHPAGIIVGRSNRAVSLAEWEELGISAPADKNSPEPFLGDSAATEELRGLSSTSP